MHIELHFIVKNLNKLLHGWKVTRFQLRPHRYIYKNKWYRPLQIKDDSITDIHSTNMYCTVRTQLDTDLSFLLLWSLHSSRGSRKRTTQQLQNHPCTVKIRTRRCYERAYEAGEEPLYLLLLKQILLKLRDIIIKHKS